MGLVLNAIDLILVEKKRSKLEFNNKDILIMGYQDIYFSKSDIRDLYKHHSIESIYVEDSKKKDVQLLDLFKDLGFRNVDVLDNSDYEGANIIIDMNKKNEDKSLKSNYDFILDWGTIEHVFHVPNYISNIYDFLKKDGYYYGVTPMSGWVEHGFYQFSPVFFRDGFKDEWEKVFLKILNFKVNTMMDDWHILSYDYNDMHRYAMGGFDDQLYQSYFLFKKKLISKKENNIQQSHFENRWNKSEIKKNIPLSRNQNKKNIKDFIINFINFFMRLFNYKVSINKFSHKSNSCDSILREFKDFTINAYKKIESKK